MMRTHGLVHRHKSESEREANEDRQIEREMETGREER